MAMGAIGEVLGAKTLAQLRGKISGSLRELAKKIFTKCQDTGEAFNTSLDKFASISNTAFVEDTKKLSATMSEKGEEVAAVLDSSLEKKISIEDTSFYGNVKNLAVSTKKRKVIVGKTSKDQGATEASDFSSKSATSTKQKIVGSLEKANKPLKKLYGKTNLKLKKTIRGKKESTKVVSPGSKPQASIGYSGIFKGFLGSSLKQQVKTQDALRKLSTSGVKDLESLRKAAIETSNTFSTTTRVGFLEAAKKIKSGVHGISDSALTELTRISAVAATATAEKTGEMAAALASAHKSMRSQFGSDTEFAEKMGAALVKAHRAFGSTAKGMGKALNELGDTGSKSGAAPAEQMAVINTLGGGKKAGAGYKAILENIPQAGKKLGMSFLDDQGKAKSMVQILKEIENGYAKAKDKSKFKAKLKEAFGGSKEAVAALSTLQGKSGELREKIFSLNQAMAKGKGYTNEMAQNAKKGLGPSLKLAQSCVENLKNSIGKALAPAVAKIARVFSKFVSWLQRVAEENPNLVRTIVGLGLAISGLLTILPLLVGVFSAISGALAILKISALIASKAMLRLFIVMLSNPIVLVITAVVAAIVGLMALFPSFREAVIDFLDLISFGALKEVMSWFSDDEEDEKSKKKPPVKPRSEVLAKSGQTLQQHSEVNHRQQGRVKVDVDFKNSPPGMQVKGVSQEGDDMADVYCGHSVAAGAC
jgi:TP901 family phage tail tape measure protein